LEGTGDGALQSIHLESGGEMLERSAIFFTTGSFSEGFSGTSRFAKYRSPGAFPVPGLLFALGFGLAYSLSRIAARMGECAAAGLYKQRSN
jgi:hypothetical protein